MGRGQPLTHGRQEVRETRDEEPGEECTFQVMPRDLSPGPEPASQQRMQPLTHRWVSPVILLKPYLGGT